MRPSTVLRLVEGARSGSLILTVSEAAELRAELTPRAAIVIPGRPPVEIASLPWFLIPDHPAELLELDPWRRNVHESFVEGLIGPADQRGLFELADEVESCRRVYDQDRDRDA